MRKFTFVFLLFASFHCLCQNADSSSVKMDGAYSFQKKHLYITPGIAFSKELKQNYGIGIEYALTNVVGFGIGFSTALLKEKNPYSKIKSTPIRASAVGLSFGLHTGFQKKSMVFDFSPSFTASRLVGKTSGSTNLYSYYKLEPLFGYTIGTDFRLYFSKTAGLNIGASKALNGSEGYAFSAGLTLRFLNKK